jgi:hypothetical protein
MLASTAPSAAGLTAEFGDGTWLGLATPGIAFGRLHSHLLFSDAADRTVAAMPT